MRIPPGLDAALAEQHGLLTRTQLIEHGCTAAEIRWAVGRTARVVLPQVLATFTGELSPRQRLVAAALYAGAEAQLAGVSAVRFLGLADVPEDGLIRLLVPAHRDARRSGFVVVRRTQRPEPRPWHRGPLAVSPPVRALVDAARELRHPDQVRGLLIGAVQRRRVTAGQLLAEIEAGPRRGSAMARRAVAEAATGAWSVPEVDVLVACSRSRVLPRVWPNPRLVAADGTALPSPDGWIDEVGLAIQVHSRRHHLRDQDWEATVQGDTLLGTYGIPVLAVTPRGFATNQVAFVERVERAYLELVGRGSRPDVRMLPRGPGLLPAA
ncbi:MAG: hypothetical protein M3P23_11820 [Actinomycetota bacterium]|nr:hypothetical protein [Actinomycetota bacterium]